VLVPQVIGERDVMGGNGAQDCELGAIRALHRLLRTAKQEAGDGGHFRRVFPHRKPDRRAGRCGPGQRPATHYCAVYDGHGGPHTSRFLAHNLIDTVASTKEFAEGPLQPALEVGFKSMDEQLLAKSKPEGLFTHDGTTACTVWLQPPSMLMVANLGDSRAVLSRNGKAYQLSHDHKPDDEAERTRIEALGGYVLMSGVPRVQGVLAVARAFGDISLKPYVSALPEISQVDLTPEDEFVIVASDGLWDTVDNQLAVDLAKTTFSKEGQWDAAAEALANRAIRHGSFDNVTVVIMSLECLKVAA